MKQGINIHLPVTFDIDLSDVTQIDFIFKTQNCPNAEAVKTAVYKSDGTGDCELKPNTTDTILVPWTRAETYLFPVNRNFFMDTLVSVAGSTDNPPTNIVTLKMTPTLFDEEGD